ncbi:phosphoglycerate dehydrogenase [Haoranjiania flava]|uniref:D-3-phosphoglycerate dehydrogenase n=1 Tax=Haoranjiania flava TaxID=1856322 RepID=A0AAE3IMM5_9BACT|nr:phosphoglycerate dehydrogenase [Haoranjiania flava]MCU7693091.1 phosphoglycerate dehydrogenase [Haoranjiania flava]
MTSYPKEKINILFLENLSHTAVETFKNNGYNVVTHTGALGEAELLKAIQNVHIIGIRSKTQLTEKVLKEARKLQSIGCFCIGTNQVDLRAAEKKGIAVFNAPYSNTRSVAELVIGASILLIRRLIDKNKMAHEGVWLKESKNSHELRGKTMGIVGYGNIGTQLSVLAEAVGMHVIYYDIETKLPLGNANACKSLKELLQKADIVSLHVPEKKDTEHMINRSNLKYFKPGAILINYARGSVVDLDALADAIKKGHVGGAAVDVFPEEPEKSGDTFSSPLQGLPNVFLSPHIGGSTEEAQANIGVDVSSKLLNFLESGVTYGCITIPALSLPLHPNSHRILHIHKNMPGVLSAINTELSKHDINIVGQYLKTNETIGYVVLDIDKKISNKALDLLKHVKETIKVRLLY